MFVDEVSTGIGPSITKASSGTEHHLTTGDATDGYTKEIEHENHTTRRGGGDTSGTNFALETRRPDDVGIMYDNCGRRRRQSAGRTGRNLSTTDHDKSCGDDGGGDRDCDEDWRLGFENKHRAGVALAEARRKLLDPPKVLCFLHFGSFFLVATFRFVELFCSSPRTDDLCRSRKNR